MPYNHRDIETKWIKNWSESNIYKTPEIQTGDKKKYILEAFPYPSGDGLHVGHALPMTAGDITSRFYRMNGYSVLHPMGWDSFGLPTENFAKKKGMHPQDVTDNAIANFTKQIYRLGVDYDWNKELATSSPEYYKWTQWFFQLLYKRGLAYKKEALVNWDPVDMTVLANEQVLADGTAERSGAKVEQKMMSQWFFKITDYAERLLAGLENLNWPESTKLMQKNWIGKSVGAEVEFAVEGNSEPIKIFTTRVDTIFGVTYVVLAPEHHLVDDLTIPEQFEAVAEYKEKSKQKSQFERTEMNKNKTGVFTGSYCINQFNGEKVPVWVGDYVLASYGTGAVMAVPAHDERDYEFAKKYNLEIKQSIKPKNEKEIEGCFAEYGILVDSGEFTSLTTEEAKVKMAEFAQDQGFGNAKVTYRLRDWSIGRQRYWGCPIPVVYGKNKPNQTILVDAINTLFIKQEDGLVLNTELADYLNYLDAQKIIVTNAKDEILTKLEELIKDYSWKIFSLKFNPEKTSPEFYQIAIKELNLDVTNTIYFDHLPANLEAAKYNNINCFQYLNNKQAIELVNDFINGVKLIPESDLPVLLPQDLDLSTGMIKPLRSNIGFINSAASIYGEGWTREGDTMDTFVCSSWYFFRYCSGNIDNAFANPEDMKKWMSVDQYIIGAEHSTMHLLYARFFTKVLFDAGYIGFDEPFQKMRHQGLILGPDGAKMSKSKGNVINPNEVFDEYGADTLRMYEMFMGPFDQPKPWSTSSIKGVRRFLDRVWNLQERVYLGPESSAKLEVNKIMYGPKTEYTIETGLNKLIKKIGEDIESYGFNTCVSEFMKFINLVEDTGAIALDQMQRFLTVLTPFAPFITEELWSILNSNYIKAEVGNSPLEGWQAKPDGVLPLKVNSIHLQLWPTYDPNLLIESTVTIGVQINGKARGEVELSPTETEENTQKIVMELDFVKRNMEGKTIRKFVYVPGRIVNVVVG
jgi:leucyl-tRNA synthetase